MLKGVGLVGLVVFLSGCASIGRPPDSCPPEPCPPRPSPTPRPTPTPTPEPTPGPGNTDLLLKTDGQNFVNPKGEVVDVNLFASCCWSEEPEPSPDWSLISEEYMDFLLPQYGPNLLIHIRLGPWTPTKYFPERLIQFGGPYADAGNNKVDLFRWNDAFWNRIRQLVVYGRERGIRFEVDIVDGWACKQNEGWWAQEDMPHYHPWIASNNIQNLDAYSQCGKVEIKVGQPGTAMAVYEQWIRKIVDTIGDLDNVTWHDGNEILLVSGYTQAWSAGMANVLHDQEAVRGFPRHLVATNAPQTTAGVEQIDYVTVHTANPMKPSDCNTSTKPCINNEYNPPPMTPATMQSLRCDAESKGFNWGYWRHGQSLPQAEETWRLFSGECTSSGCIDIPNEGALEDNEPPSQFTTEINATLDSLTTKGIIAPDGVIKMAMRDFLPLYSQEARTLFPSNCAAQQSDNHGPVDEVCFGSKEYCQGYHVFNCKGATSCPPNNPDCGCDEGRANRAPNSSRDGWIAPETQRARMTIARAFLDGKTFLMTRQGERRIELRLVPGRRVRKQSGVPTTIGGPTEKKEKD